MEEVAGYPVHPVAALFPLLEPERLTALAEDIAAHGQDQPIVLDSTGRVLDGRNRLLACQQAGVTPRTTVYTGDDPEGYALAANGQRRDLTMGQRAIIALLAAKFGTTESEYQKRIATRIGVDFRTVSEAAIIAGYAPEQVAAVLAGMSFSQVLAVARERRQQYLADTAALKGLEPQHPDIVKRTKRKTTDPAYLTPRQAIAAIGAIAQARAEEERLEQQRKQVELERERYSHEVELPPMPDLSLKGMVQNIEVEVDKARGRMNGAALQRQAATLRALHHVSDKLESMLKEDPAIDGWDPKGQVFAIRNAASQIIADAMKLVHLYNDAYERLPVTLSLARGGEDDAQERPAQPLYQVR